MLDEIVGVVSGDVVERCIDIVQVCGHRERS